MVSATTDQQWPKWMAANDIELYKKNGWRIPTGPLKVRTGQEEPSIPGYRLHHTGRMPRSESCFFYFEPIPDYEPEQTGDPTFKAGPINVSNIPKAKREDQPPAVLPVWAIIMRNEYEAQLADLKRKVYEYEMSLIQQNQAKMYLTAQPSAITLHGGEDNVQAMKRQLALSPKFADLTADEHEYVARLALGMGLNPEFHFHAWKSKKSIKDPQTGKWKTVEVLNVTPDYKALIFKSKSERRVMMKDRKLTPAEMKERGILDLDIEEGSIAWVVELYDLGDMALCNQSGIVYEPLRGYGVWAAKKTEKSDYDEKTKKYGKVERVPNDVPNGRDGAFVAWKRACRALFYLTADMSLTYLPKPASGPQPQIISSDDDIYEYAPTLSTVEGEYTVKKEVEEQPASTRWQDEPGRIEKAAEWMASLGVTDDQYLESTGTNWRTFDITADEFKFAVELLAENKPAQLEADDQPQEPPSPPVAAESSEPEPPQEPEKSPEAVVQTEAKATEAEIIAIVDIFAHQHSLTVAQARQKLAELAGINTLYNYTGTYAQLIALADSQAK